MKKIYESSVQSNKQVVDLFIVEGFFCISKKTRTGWLREAAEEKITRDVTKSKISVYFLTKIKPS